MNPVIDSLVNHRSVRKYTDKPIQPDILQAILNAGIRAANGGNLQLYTMLVIDEDETLKKLDKALEVPFISHSNCRLAILALVDLHRVRQWIRIHTDRDITTNRPYNFFMGIWDALIALQNMVAAAESLGIGTCYIGSGPELDIRELFEAPEHVFPAGLVCLGYPEKTPNLSMRLPIEAVVHHNRYRIPSDESINTWYEERDAVWEKVPDHRKAELAEQGIDGIASALSIQKFSPEIVEKRSKGMLRNLRKSGFDLVTGLNSE